VRGVHDLLDAVDVAGEAGDDDALRGGPEDRLDRGDQVPLGGEEPGDLGVGGVGEEEVDALLAELDGRPRVQTPLVGTELVVRASTAPPRTR
jgi:hypothetical protein